MVQSPLRSKVSGCMLIGEGGKKETMCLLSLSGVRDSTSRCTPGKQDSVEPASPGPICGRQQSVIRLYDVADGKI